MSSPAAAAAAAPSRASPALSAATTGVAIDHATASPTLSPVVSVGQQQQRRGGSARSAYAQQDKALAADPKFKRYQQVVEKTLQSFDNVNEWADFITFLAKLLKCLQGFPQFQVIPHKLIVAKRLSQCLNPALPTGVHQRALDVYTHILTTIGPENLKRDLPAWSSGLFPFFQYAATSVKPIILGIYERFYLPLQENLRPATKAFILALLPGLEEETGEFFEKVAALMDRVSGTVSPSFFLQNLWLVLVTAPKSRIPALNYLSRRLPKMQADDGISHIVGQDIGLMIRGFAAALEDPQILVQRGILDLLTSVLPLSSNSFAISTRKTDQVLLMRAVAGVVLRRDLSLSRRLYTWLVGTSEGTKEQVEYLKQWGLDLLRTALKADMISPSSSSADRLRPFKVFISLLDKWEIGAPLTEVLVLDAFSALEASLNTGTNSGKKEGEGKETEQDDELLMTGNMLFEIVDPFLTWKEMFKGVDGSLSSPGGGGNRDGEKSIELARFVARTFRLHDDEVQKLHAPCMAFAVIDLVEAALSSSSSSSSSKTLLPLLPSALALVSELVAEIAPKFFELAAEQDDGNAESCPVGHNIAFTRSLYQANDVKASDLLPPEGHELFANGLTAVMRLVQGIAERMVETGETATLAPTLLAAFRVLDTLADAAGAITRHRVIQWDLARWVDQLVLVLGVDKASPALFGFHSAVLQTILKAGKTTLVLHRLPKNRRPMLEAMSEKLLQYLQPGCTPCFMEAAQLTWGVEGLSTCRHLESFIAERLASPDTAVRLAAFEAFGNLWRFTDDSLLPGLIFRTPMLMMLDGLKAEELSTRRAAESWMRCSLKSYLRILDPLLFMLLSPTIQYKPVTVPSAGLEVPVLVYTQQFDQARIHHVLDDLLSLARFGGQGFIRISKGTLLKHTLDPALRERVMARDLGNHTYLDGLVAVLVDFLQAEPSQSLRRPMLAINHHIHAVVAELLQVIISRGESDVTGLQSIEASLVTRLYLCVHRSELDLQNKFLHVLHSVIHAVAALHQRRHNRGGSGDSSAGVTSDALRPVDVSRDAMFVRVVTDALSTQSSSAIIHHWVDFLLMTVAQFRHSLLTIVIPLIDCLVARVRRLIEELLATYTGAATEASDSMDAEFTVLMNALERLLLMALTESRTSPEVEEARQPERQASEMSVTSSSAGGLLGYMTNVLGTGDASTAGVNGEPRGVKHTALLRLQAATHLFLFTWISILKLEDSETQNTSKGYIAGRSKVRVKKAFEHVYKAAPGDVLEHIVTYWAAAGGSKDADQQANIFEMVDLLAPSAQTVVSLLCERLSPRATGSTEKQKTPSSPLSPSDETAFEFLESYINHIEGLKAVQVWSVCHSFVREFLNNASASRPFIFSCLRCFTALSEKVSQTSALEDRRMRRDLQDTFIKLVDATLIHAGKVIEVEGWGKRESNGDTESLFSERTAKKEEVSDGLEEKGLPAGGPASTQAAEITTYLTEHVLTNLRRFLIDNDKTLALCSNMIYYIVSPSFKTRSKTLDVDHSVLLLLGEMAKNPAALKAWRSQVSDVFSDNRFFNSTPSTHALWKPVIQALMTSDKERVVELASKISTIPSANIFTNRELESLSRALSLRRLTYTIFTGPKNRFLTQLPIIQEKVVDLLRGSVGDMVSAEVYLCLRVLLCRVGNEHMSGLWPVILTELLRLFESLVDSTVADGSDLLQLVLSACKFLDLTLVLQTEEFQIHQWMFVTDTVDAIYPPDAWMPQAIMDRLGEMLQVSTSHHSTFGRDVVPDSSSSRSLALKTFDARRPLLTKRRIETLGALEPFFTTVSLQAYESVYNSGGRVDWDAVEQSIIVDLLDGEE